MANARALDKRRKSVQNIKKITRTMELIATARFKQAMDRATAATDYTKRITKVVAGQSPEVAQKLAEIYGKLNNGNVFINQGYGAMLQLTCRIAFCMNVRDFF